LSLEGNDYRADGLRAPARSPYLENLKYLSVYSSWRRDLSDVRAELDACLGSVINYEFQYG